MSIAVPVTGECATHAGVKADWACQRCGSFVCKECERRTRPDAPPLCPKCWALRDQVVQVHAAEDSSRMQKAGLALGIFALNPLVMIASFIVNIRELKSGRGGSRRWMNQVGMGLTVVFLLFYVALIFIVALQ